jgi:hypothetical protein
MKAKPQKVPANSSKPRKGLQEGLTGRVYKKGSQEGFTGRFYRKGLQPCRASSSNAGARRPCRDRALTTRSAAELAARRQESGRDMRQRDCDGQWSTHLLTCVVVNSPANLLLRSCFLSRIWLGHWQRGGREGDRGIAIASLWHPLMHLFSVFCVVYDIPFSSGSALKKAKASRHESGQTIPRPVRAGHGAGP